MKKTESNFEYFVYFIFPLLILFFGLIGNLIGLMTIKKRAKKLEETGATLIYELIFIVDTIFLCTIINYYCVNAFSIGITLLTNWGCKLFNYSLSYSFSTVSTLLLIYILIERFLSIKYPVESNILRNKKTQLIYFLFILILNHIYYFPILFSYHLIPGYYSNNTYFRPSCTYYENYNKTMSILLFFGRFFFPLLLIFTFTVLLVCSYYKSNSRMSTFYTDKERKMFKKDVHISIMSIFYNIIQFSFNLPLNLLYFGYKQNTTLLLFSFYIFYLSYAFNFYFILTSSSLFRREFISMFKKKTFENEIIEMI